MSKTIEEAAVKYAEDKVLPETALRGFIDGAFFSLTHQWRSVEDELPPIDEDVVVLYLGFVIAYYDGEYWHTTYGKRIRPTHWLPIPSLNPEQR